MFFPEIQMPPLDEVKKHFTLFDYIEGERTAPTVDMKAFVHNPNTGEKIAPQMATSPENIERALQWHSVCMKRVSGRTLLPKNARTFLTTLLIT